MSLWEKWEREKLRKAGIHVQDPKGVEVHESYTKPNLSRQIAISLAVCAGCLLLVLAAMLAETLVTGRQWSNTYIVRLFAAMQRTREEQAAQNP